MAQPPKRIRDKLDAMDAQADKIFAQLETLENELNALFQETGISLKPKKQKISFQYIVEEIYRIEGLKNKAEIENALQALDKTLDNTQYDFNIDGTVPSQSHDSVYKMMTLLGECVLDPARNFEIFCFLLKKGANPAWRPLAPDHLKFKQMKVYDFTTIERALERRIPLPFFQMLFLDPKTQNPRYINVPCKVENVFANAVQKRPQYEYMTPLEILTAPEYVSSTADTSILFLLAHEAEITPLVLKHIVNQNYRWYAAGVMRSQVFSTILTNIRNELLFSNIPCTLTSLQQDTLYRLHLITQENKVRENNLLEFLRLDYFSTVILPCLTLYHEQHRIAEALRSVLPYSDVDPTQHMSWNVLSIIMQYSIEHATLDPKHKAITEIAHKVVRNVVALHTSDDSLDKIQPQTFKYSDASSNPFEKKVETELLCIETLDSPQDQQQNEDRQPAQKESKPCLWLLELNRTLNQVHILNALNAPNLAELLKQRKANNHKIHWHSGSSPGKLK